jgi:hypothetical protein
VGGYRELMMMRYQRRSSIENGLEVAGRKPEGASKLSRVAALHARVLSVPMPVFILNFISRRAGLVTPLLCFLAQIALTKVDAVKH